MSLPQSLSPDHPLQSDPARPWPYAVTVGYRLKGRTIVKRRVVYVRSTSMEEAMGAAIKYCRQQSAELRDTNGRKLYPSRALSSRPLDKGDRI